MMPPAAPAAFDPQAFKTVMRKIAGTVTVIATASETGLHGMTATAMCSVSADPPMVLIVVNRSARTHLHIDTKKAFTLSILGEDQLAVADLFATKSDDPFSQVEHRLLADGCPVIEEAAAHVHCVVEAQLDAGTHTIFIGRVEHAAAGAALPLVYQDARYRRLGRHVPPRRKSKRSCLDAVPLGTVAPGAVGLRGTANPLKSVKRAGHPRWL